MDMYIDMYMDMYMDSITFFGGICTCNSLFLPCKGHLLNFLVAFAPEIRFFSLVKAIGILFITKIAFN